MTFYFAEFSITYYLWWYLWRYIYPGSCLQSFLLFPLIPRHADCLFPPLEQTLIQICARVCMHAYAHTHRHTVFCLLFNQCQKIIMVFCKLFSYSSTGRHSGWEEIRQASYLTTNWLAAERWKPENLKAPS